MTDEQKIFFTRENIKHVIDLLTGIDQKIVDLHEISSKDFLVFNVLLKEYHQKAKQITKTASELFDFFCNLDQFHIVENAQAMHLAANLKIQSIQQVSLQVSDSIRKSKEDIAQLFVPFNNFRQNLMTLKFLFTSVKLTQWISDPVRAREISDLVDNITSHIQNTKDGLPVLDDDIQTLSGQMSVIFDLIQNLLNEVLPEINVLRRDLDHAVQTIIELKNKAVEDSRKIEQLSQRCFKNLDSVITNLQYHDIIRQKMEHIQTTHKTIIDDLNAVENDSEYEKNSVNYIKQIPEVAEIQAAQLMFTNKEYQSAIETITQKLLETGSDLLGISEICTAKVVNIQKIETVVQKLMGKSTTTYNQFQILSDLAVQLTTNCAFYQDKIEEQVSKKQEMHEIEEKLRTLSEKIKANKRTDVSQIDVFTRQIDPLLADIHNSRMRMENLIPDARHSTIRNQLISLTELIAVATMAIKVPAADQQVELIDKLNTVKDLVENMENINATELKKSIEQVIYYDVFDKEVETIIESLNKIYVMLVPFNNATKSTKNLLSNMESMYTMKTQRDLHGIQGSEKEEETDFELF
ncbi:MAG: hypothetical protein PHU27_10280 [Salinivirgaceae bacterium]|nr:hypothetical protein [Salinivirgaceae bacterium]MDD4746625.1 hypothetical protein [Salinivirgaceae bacterium]MDY0279689.1 hypothetical protein [Salinivirgaceae bacterium]